MEDYMNLSKLTNLIQITNEDGSVKTFFNGSITATQLIFIVAVIIVGLILMAKLKRIGKIVVLVAVIASTYFNVQLFSPTKMLNTATVFVNSPLVKEQVTELANKSDSIRLSGDNLEIKVMDNWISLNAITSVIQLDDGNVSISVGDQNFVVSDEMIIKVLNMFTKM